MINTVHQIENVDSILLAEKLVVRLKNGDICLLNSDLVKVVENAYSFELHKNDLFYQLKNLDKINKVQLNSVPFATDSVDGVFSLRGGFYASENYHYVLGKENGKTVVYILEPESLAILDIVGYVDFPSVATPEGCICRGRSEVKYVSPLLRDSFWNYVLSEDEEIIGNFYVHGSILVTCSMTGQMPLNTNYITGIDISSGKEIWRRESYFVHLQQDTRSGWLYGFAGGRYEVVDPKDGRTVYRRDFTDLFRAKKMEVYQGMSRLCGSDLYFISDHIKDVFACQFGKINIETNEIDFIQTLDIPDGVNAEPPLYYEGRIYIKDSSDVLHVFEKVKPV